MTYEQRGDALHSERASALCETVPPQLTKPCDLGHKGGVVTPSWDSQGPLIFNVDLDEALRPNVLIFFELLEFGPSIPKLALEEGEGFYRTTIVVKESGRRRDSLQCSSNKEMLRAHHQ